MKRLTPRQIRHVYDQGPDAVIDLVTQLFDIMDRLESDVHALKSRGAELERQVHPNSHNSSQSPSADGLKKPPPKSQRRPSGRPRGGQPGHPGETLEMVDAPDGVERDPVALCEECGASLDAVLPNQMIRQHVFDIPPLSLIVTEHQAEVKVCPTCHHRTTGIFPADVVAPVQYGPRVLALSTYLQVFQMIPIDRIRPLFVEWWDQAPSGRTLVDAATRIGDRVAPFLIPMREAFRQAPVIHGDETGFRVEGRLGWMHTATAPGYALYGLHPRRGQEGIADLEVMDQRHGVAVHDVWSPYYRVPGRHALCNAHLLRDRTGLYEVTGEAWVATVRSLLVDMLDAANQARAAHQTHVDPARVASYQAYFSALVHQGRQRHPDPPASGRRGRVKRDLAQNLLRRLEFHRPEILAFLDDLTIPFDNNAAERALCMMKVKQKVFGAFRTAAGAKTFATIRSCVMTAIQQGQAPLTTLWSVLAGDSWIPS